MGKSLACRVPRKLTVGSDFTGMHTAGFALQNLGVHHTTEFTCVNHSPCERVAKFHFHPKIHYRCITKRQTRHMPTCHLYTWTAPCISFSTNGTMRGENHPAGKLLRVPFKYMNRHRPRCVVMENVAALFQLKKYRNTVKKILYHMKSMGYAT